mmetsp:Transcript_17900/g.49637  ORF Transcript_17900/g.49637 Transcript_17900/m.49637 type:complete len:164 (-) Transcript_17900:202-693(-)
MSAMRRLCSVRSANHGLFGQAWTHSRASRAPVHATRMAAKTGLRFQATSAQKRKWKRQGHLKHRGGGRMLADDTKVPETSVSAAEASEKGFDWKPLFFLVIFPLAMTGVVVIAREDLQQEVKDLRLSVGTRFQQDSSPQEEKTRNDEVRDQQGSRMDDPKTQS